MDLKWYLYYEWNTEGVATQANLEEFDSREALNRKLESLQCVSRVVAISGYTLADRTAYDTPSI